MVEVNRTPTDLCELVREGVEEHRGSAEMKGLRLLLETPEEVRIIHTDASRVRQILGNLLSNAIKYTNQGGVRVRIESPSANATKPRIGVRVVDTGVGIPPEKRHLLFQEFSRLSPDREGVGLGLAISRRVAKALGGDITEDSEPGKGATFTLWLPADGVGATANRVA